MKKHGAKSNKRTRVAWFFIVAAVIFALTYLSFFGVKNYYGDKENVYIKGADTIRWGIDIKGGVEAVFSPEDETYVPTAKELENAKEIINARLINQGITDYETSVDTKNKQIVVRFPWSSDEADYDASSAINELGSMAVLTFCYGSTYDEEQIVLTGADVQSAEATTQNGATVVALNLKSSGSTKFANATQKAYSEGSQIAICLDQDVISAPKVNAVISNGKAVIEGVTAEEAVKLASYINAGALPFALSVDDSKLQVISPTLGEEALNTMTVAGIIAFAVICLIMILFYRLPGVVACIALLGQVGGIIACITRFFGDAASFTLTIPGITGIILSIGMGVDANVITSERIKEEINSGKTVTGAINAGCSNAMSAIIDGNITNVLVAVVLMGAFGPSDDFFAKILSPLMSNFGASVSGTVYSFGYTLLIGVILNFVMGVFASKIMIKSISGFKVFRKPWFYGGVRNEEA